MRLRHLVLMAPAIILLWTLPASASSVTDYVTFTATNFNAPFGGTPTSPVNGAFTLTLDPTQSYANDTADITLNSLNITLGSSISFTYNPATDFLSVGGIQSNDGLGTQLVQISPATNDFYLQINTFIASPTYQQFGYSQATGGEVYFYTNTLDGSVTVGPVPTSPTPLPAALPLFASGLGALGLLGWRRKRKAQAVA